MSKVSPAGQRAIEQARQGDFDGALATATEAIARKPDDAGLRFFAGMPHVRRSELPEAADQLRKAVELEPTNVEAQIGVLRLTP